jgi:hypothetical protein
MKDKSRNKHISLTKGSALVILLIMSLLGGGCGTLKTFKMDLKIEEDSFERTEGGGNPDTKGVSGHYKDKTEIVSTTPGVVNECV